MDHLRSQLRELYGDRSKHANYQNVPAFVRDALGYQESIDESWRGDTARYAYLLQELDLYPGQRVADVGANTGFFVLSLAQRFPDCYFVAYETNPNHVDFIRLVVEAFGLANVSVQASSIDLQGVQDLPAFDVLLHLNVLHHAGHDFDRGKVNAPQDIDRYAAAYLGSLADKSSIMAFQTGYNWGGDKARPIIPPQNQPDMVRWLVSLFERTGWQIDAMAFAVKEELGDAVYRNLPIALLRKVQHSPEAASELVDLLRTYHPEQFKGEFYRRPMVICRSKKLAASVSSESRGANT